MRVFEELTREQAALYRWLLTRLSNHELSLLTSKDLAGARPEHVDHALREAYHYDHSSAADIIDQVQVKAGILPEDIGQALVDYGIACAAVAVDELMPNSNLEDGELEREQIAALQHLADVILRRLK